MIKVKHPIEEFNRKQEEFVAYCPQSEGRFHELLFTYGNLAYLYHQQALKYGSLEDYWKEWLEGLPNNIKKDMEKRGFESCKNILSFTRFVLEKNDIGMDEYIRKHMDEEDYFEYKKLITKE